MSLSQKILIGVFLFLLIIYNLAELYEEIMEVFSGEEPISELMIEATVVIFSISVLAYFTYIIIQQYRSKLNLEDSLKQIKQELKNSNIRLQNGKKEYRKIIEWQFKEWKLTPSEQEVALMLLKGLTSKEISQHRSTQEKTVRKQASTVYEKSRLRGRHELSAWFFEDLL